MPGMKLSLAITTYNRYDFTIESFAHVTDDPRIDDIVILDDCSTDGSYERLRDYFKGNEKVRVIRQAQNRGMLVNKFHAVGYCKNDFVALLDSDNVFGKGYFDALNNTGLYNTPQLYREIIYMPSFAKPTFDYRNFSGKMYNRFNVVDLLSDNMGNCLLNTCNYVVHRDSYCKIFEDNKSMKGTDTLWFNYLWLKADYFFYVVPEMQYYHRQHEGSTWVKDAAYNMAKAAELNKKILSL